MLKYLLYIFFIISLGFTSVRVFHIDQYVINFIGNNFGSTEAQKEEITPEKSYTFSELIARGDSYLKQGFVELARDEYLSAIKKDNKNTSSYIKLSNTQTLLKNYKGAILNLQEAEKIENTQNIQILIAKNYIHLFDFESALKILKPFKGNEEADYYLDVLNIFSQGKVDKEMKILHKDTFEKSKRLSKAFEEFRLIQSGQNIFLKALIAQALIDNEDYELSINLINKILTERSDYRDSWIMLGYANINIENYTEAKNALEKAYDLDPVKAETQYFLAIALEELGDKEKAYEFYELAYKNKYEPKVHIIQKIAELSLEFEEYKKAFDLYEEFLKLNHEEVDSFIRPIWIAVSKLSDLQKAEKLAQWARSAFPMEAQSFNLLAWVEIEKGDFQRAQEFLNQAFQIDPNFSAGHYNQGRIYEKVGETEKAIKSYETAYQLDKDGPIGKVAAEDYNRILSNDM